jgi:lysyl-tRNA synthetase class 2
MARPFVTHHRDLDMDLYLRISLELHLKRLLVGGLERVYEIGRNFRNEGVGWKYNPEFTMLELYRAYADYETMMDVTRDLVQASALAVTGSLEVSFRGNEIELGGEWSRVTVLGSVSEAVGEEVTLDRPDLAELAERHDVPVDPSWPSGKIALELFEKLVEPGLIQPTFVCDFPRDVSPLARPHRDDPRLTEHVDPVIGGMELGTGYSELTDPDEQRAKFVLQQQGAGGRRAGDPPVRRGLPPGARTRDAAAGGLGIGIDRLLMLLTDAASIREVILFPLHRPRTERRETRTVRRPGGWPPRAAARPGRWHRRPGRPPPRRGPRTRRPTRGRSAGPARARLAGRVGAVEPLEQPLAFLDGEARARHRRR